MQLKDIDLDQLVRYLHGVESSSDLVYVNRLSISQSGREGGKIDVVLVRKASRWQMLQLFKRVFDGSHLSLDCVEYHQVRRLSILADCQQPLDLDGENKGRVPVSVEVLPGAIRVFGPLADDPGGV